MDSLPSALDATRSQAAAPGSSAERVSSRAAPAVSFREVLESLGTRLEAGEHQVERALAPIPGLDAQHLLALQVAAYRYTEVVDLAAKLVDKASSAVKTVVQGQ